jgi:hypothetical protein
VGESFDTHGTGMLTHRSAANRADGYPVIVNTGH